MLCTLYTVGWMWHVHDKMIMCCVVLCNGPVRQWVFVSHVMVWVCVCSVCVCVCVRVYYWPRLAEVGFLSCDGD